MKGISRLALAVLGAVVFASCVPGGTSREQMADGTFEGLGVGRNGMIRIAVDIKNHRIDAARVLSQSETAFVQPCIDEMINRIIEAQSVDVDAISGATLTFGRCQVGYEDGYRQILWQDSE